MKKYQDILRDQTSRNFAAKGVNTSMLMLPLRLETKIMTREVDVTDEPERALEAFKLLHNLLQHYYQLVSMGGSKSRNEEATRNLKLEIGDVIAAFEKLDLLYAEDKSYLKDLAQGIYHTLHSVELQDAFEPLLWALDDITRLTTRCDKAATTFLRQLERITRMLENTARRPLFSGHRREGNPEKYSQTARFKLADKRYQEINSWFEVVRNKRKIVELASAIQPGMMTKSQYAKYTRLTARIVAVLDDPHVKDYTVLTRAYPLEFSPMADGHPVANKQSDDSVDATSRRFKQWSRQHLVDTAHRLHGNLRSFIDQDMAALGNTLAAKLVPHGPQGKRMTPQRYTLLVSKLMTAQLSLIKARIARHPAQHRKAVKGAYRCLSRLEEITRATYFTHEEQREFARQLVACVSKMKYNRRPELVIQGCAPIGECLVTSAGGINRTKSCKCLCLRIYPDVVALLQTARQISRQEYLAGKDFWLKYIYNGDEDYRQSLWLAMCDIYPPYRAAFILKRTYPAAHYKTMCRKAREFHDNKLPIEDFIREIDDNFVNSFPTTYVDNGEQLFTVPVTNLLPDRFVVHAAVKTRVKASRTIVQYGHRLPRQLQVGIDLNHLDSATREKHATQGKNQLYLNGGVSWMTDYDEAERLGMAITVPLDAMKTGLKQSVRKFEFNEIFVYGINEAGASECDKMIEELLTAHLYSGKAMDIIPFDAASNIITDEDAKWAFDSSESKQRERFKHQAHNCVNPHKPEKGNDLDILDRLLGLKESVLGNLDDPSAPAAAEVELQRRVNRLMIEYMTDPALGPLVNPLLTAIKGSPLLYDYLCNDVLPRGPFPMLRIGDQPYGILPACDLRNLAVKSSNPLAIVKKILLVLTTHWNSILEQNIVTCYGKDSQGGGATVTTHDYLHILGNTPRSTSFYKRKMVKGGVIDAEYWRGELYQNQIEELTQMASNLGIIAAGDKEKIKSIIPDYDYVPVKVPNEETQQDDACLAVHDALDLDNIVGYITASIRKSNEASTGLKLSESPELIRSHVIEFFDIFNYRLDAWLMGIVAGKLRMRMERGTHRLALGCFGWLFNLREEDDFKLGCTDEYIIAPSINHAITGAILRSAYNNSLKNGKAHNYDMGVNLSSQRVRTAIRIIEGIQNGLSLGCILGADMERLIHEAWKTTTDKLELDSCIYPLRQRYPLVTGDNRSDSGSPATITVLNGASLLDEYATHKDKGKAAVRAWLMGQELRLFNGDINQNVKVDALISIIDRIDDEKDALTDLVLSESVYQLTQGNTEASAAISRALERLQNIPKPQVAEIPITSAQIDGYMLAMLPIDAVSDQPDSLLASIEPKVEAWLRRMMHHPDEIYMPVQGRVKQPLSLGSLGITAAEAVYLSADKASFTHFVEVLSWIKTGVYLRCDSDGDLMVANSKKHSFAECSMAIDELRNVLAAAHPLTSDDLVKKTGLPSQTVYSDMSNEYHHAVGYISRLLVNIEQLRERQLAIQNPDQADYDLAALPDEMVIEAVRILIDCYRIGNIIALDQVSPDILMGNRNAIDGVVEWKNTVQAQHALFNSMMTLHDNLKAKLAQAQGLLDDDSERKYTTHIEALKALLVTGYLVVPSFVPDGNVPIADLADQACGKRFKNVTNMEIEEMIGDLALVEQPMMHLHQVRLYQKCDGIDVARIVPMQLASVEDNTAVNQWLGTVVESEDDVRDAFTFIVMDPEHFVNAATQPQPQLAGMVIDHWVERIPYREQTAAVAFGYDQPDAEAPQTLLLAIATKDNNKHWNEKMMINSLKSAIHMVKCRTVSPDLISKDGWTGGLLPLLEYKDPRL